MIIDRFIAWLVSPRPLESLRLWLGRLKAKFVAPAPREADQCLDADHPAFVLAYIRQHERGDQ